MEHLFGSVLYKGATLYIYMLNSFILEASIC